MQTKIFFTDKALILTDTPVEVEGAVRLPSSELSKANVLKIFETTNSIIVCDEAIEAVKERFFGEFKYVLAAGGVVHNERGESLMIYRNHRWDLPKGHVDGEESDEECAVREIAEETGVEGAKIVRFLCNTLHSFDVYGVWEIKRTAWYELEADTTETKPQAEEGISCAKWCSEEEVAENLKATYPTIREVFAAKNE
ncbi:MAG: NUDIX domain-containing protein [Alistipes sp.]|jgi:8-oxo-dGTP pyrophosphatase MutT (NUDIX family)|nr:NUDIX domain-containing protein [Alistipes sp.]